MGGVHEWLTEEIARLENIVLNVKCGGGVTDNREHLRRFAANIWGMRSEDAKAELPLLISPCLVHHLCGMFSSNTFYKISASFPESLRLVANDQISAEAKTLLKSI